MNDSPLTELIKYRMRQAGETLQEADGLFRMSLWRGAINRSYYAMFYAVLSLAALRQHVTSKHSGAIAFFDREFVKSGIFPKDLSQSLHRAFESRQVSDYGEIFTVSEEDANQAVDEARAFVAAVEKYLELT